MCVPVCILLKACFSMTQTCIHVSARHLVKMAPHASTMDWVITSASVWMAMKESIAK